MPETGTKEFQKLVALYAERQIEFPALKPVTIAQWILESGYGRSRLASEFLNFAGLKWRKEMKRFAEPISYDAHDGTEEYCKFPDLEAFIVGFWHFLDRTPYNGWRDHTKTPEDFIKFVGAIYTPTERYAETVLSLVPVAETMMNGHEMDVAAFSKPAGTSEVPSKPDVKKFIKSPNFSSRNGERIRRIIMHYTTSRNVDGTISWFLDPSSKVSAHYVIARNGDIYQMVDDSQKAWHAKGANADSIGIEHSAAKGDRMTAEQELSSIGLVRWLLAEYKLPKSSIHGHRFTPENSGTTDCPDHLFGDASEAEIEKWVRDKI